jgi:hypothetical protein
MAPKHPVPDGYGSPCEEGEFIPQGTSSGPVMYKYEKQGDFDQDDFRGTLSLDHGNMIDDYC